MSEGGGELVCGNCGTRGGFSPLVAAITVYAPSLPDGFYVLMPDFALDQRHRLCGRCPAPAMFLRKAMAAHPATRTVADWTSATFIFADGTVQPWHLERRISERGIALA